MSATNSDSILAQMMMSGEFSDLIFICRGQEFKVHKAIVCSPVIKAAVQGEFEVRLPKQQYWVEGVLADLHQQYRNRKAMQLKWTAFSLRRLSDWFNSCIRVITTKLMNMNHPRPTKTLALLMALALKKVRSYAPMICVQSVVDTNQPPTWKISLSFEQKGAVLPLLPARNLCYRCQNQQLLVRFRSIFM